MERVVPAKRPNASTVTLFDKLYGVEFSAENSHAEPILRETSQRSFHSEQPNIRIAANTRKLKSFFTILISNYFKECCSHLTLGPTNWRLVALCPDSNLAYLGPSYLRRKNDIRTGGT